MADTPDLFKTAPAEVRRYFEAKRILPTFDWRDIAPEEHAFSWTVAKSAGFDVLDDIRSAVADAITNRVPFEQFREQLTPVLQAKGWWGRKIVEDPQSGGLEIAQLGSPSRLRTIYWANTRSAHAAGEWDRTQRNKRFLPFLVYTRSQAERRRLEHEGWVGQVLPVDHSWWHTHYPPNGWGCQCGVRQIARAEALRLGYDENAPTPAVDTRRWLNKRTGVWEDVPVGIDPGWATNPGLARGVNASRFLLDQVAAMPAYRRNAAIADIAGSPILKAMADGKMPMGSFLPVAPIPARLVEVMGSPGSLARLSADSVKHIIEERAERQLSVGDLRAAIEVLAAGEIITRRGNSAIVFGEADGRWWRVVVKTTLGGREWWLTSFHRKSAPEVAAVMRRERAAGRLVE